MAGLGRISVSLPSQFSSAFGFGRKFGICLSSNRNGAVFFGNAPNFKNLTYTPLNRNPVNTAPAYADGTPSAEYFIGVKFIRIGDEEVPIPRASFKIDRSGIGGTKISTVAPYTVLESYFHDALVFTFLNRIPQIPRVSGVHPFKVCLNSTGIPNTPTGPAVPTIELVLEWDKIWKILGANSMVRVSKDVICLGIVDGGFENVRTPIMIGGDQLEDNLLEFDPAKSRLGFSSSLLSRRRTCADFNFTSFA